MRKAAILHLDKEFRPVNAHNYLHEITAVPFYFKGGEPHIKIDQPGSLESFTDIIITHRIHRVNDFGMLAVAVDAIKNANSEIKIEVVIPYFPGARQDRMMVPGEPVTSAVFVNLFASLDVIGYSSFDVHSEVVPGMFKVLGIPFNNMNNHFLVAKAVEEIEGGLDTTDVVIISPDAGANKKIEGVVAHLSNALYEYPWVQCGKTRDLDTGALTGFTIGEGDVAGKDCVIVDDICDGGGTFLGLAELLKKKGAKRLFLITTFGIYSGGIDKLTKVFDGVYCSDGFNPTMYSQGVISEKFHQFKIKLSW